MEQNVSKNNTLHNITVVTMIMLATACSIITIAAFVLIGCATTAPPENMSDKLSTSQHLIYTEPNFINEKATVENTDVFYTLEVVVSDEEGNNQIWQ